MNPAGIVFGSNASLDVSGSHFPDLLRAVEQGGERRYHTHRLTDRPHSNRANRSEGGRDNPGEVSAHGLDIFARDHAFVPSLWWFEVRNILVINE
jgi:hypothetical protein